MQTSNRFLHDLARVASGAVSTLAGIRSEIDVQVRQRLDRLASELDLVSREEFDAVRDMAAAARAEQERLAERIAALEAVIAARAKPARRQPQADGGET